MLPATMTALAFDRSLDTWETSKGLRKVTVPTPEFDPRDPAKAERALLRIRYAGFCGSDRGIWFRKGFRSHIHDSLDAEGRDRRITGHELLGEVVSVGPTAAAKFGIAAGDVVSAESHVVCDTCYQCRVGDHHVCANDRILGISVDGCFAEYLDVPAKVLWKTDVSRIRPEVAAVQEPFGNAVHACTKVPLEGKTVAIFGTGTIGLFAVLIARGLGATRIIGVETNPKNAALARSLGCDEVIEPDLEAAKGTAHDPRVVAAVRAATGGVGADVSLEMAGFASSLNNAVKATRRGGSIVLFGIHDGPLPIESWSHLVMDGLSLHSVVGRQIFGTWQVTRRLLEDRSNGIQDKVWTHILGGGDGTLVDIRSWQAPAFEASLLAHPKLVLSFAG